VALTLVLTCAAALMSCEFFLSYWDAPRVRRFCRWFNGLALAAVSLAWALFGHGAMLDVFLPYAAGLSLLLSIVWLVGLRKTHRGDWSALGTTVFIASTAYIGSASYDLVTDSLKLSSYRLFGYGITTCAVLAGSVVVAEFLKLGQVNERLNVQLSTTNRELSGALDRSREVDRLKTQFLASVTHELRTPLNVIVNVPDALIEDFTPTSIVTCKACNSAFELEAGENPDTTTCVNCGAFASWQAASELRFVGDGQRNVKALNLLKSSSQHLLTIVDDLLDASRLEAGRMQLTMRRERVADILSEALSLSSGIAQSHDVRVISNEQVGDAELVCDRVRLVQVITNLIANAVRFAGETRRVELETSIVGGSAHFAVKDRGRGIDPRDQSAIFQIFRQLGGAQQHRGAGLGLAIAKSLVELHGGELTVESELGQGATFRVVLPLERPSTLKAEDAELYPVAPAQRSSQV
jgi:signal transduction histidine kinase